MRETTDKVDILREKLVLTMENVKIEEEETEKLIVIVNEEAAAAQKE